MINWQMEKLRNEKLSLYHGVWAIFMRFFKKGEIFKMLAQVKKALKDVLIVLFGNTIYALAISMFVLPNGLIMGGTTGIAIVLQHFFGIPVTAFVSVFNIAMFVLGALVLGKKFAMTTLISTFYYPFILGIFQMVPSLQMPMDDRMLAALYAGAMIGIAIGLVIRAGASTGGMDIPPLICRKLFGIPVSAVMYGCDFFVLLFQMMFSDREQILYGILVVFLYTTVLDKVLFMGESKTQVKIISRKFKEINEMINNELDRGTTLLQGETGYLHEERPVVLTVVSNREVARLNKRVQEMDSEAFFIISPVKEVRGRGFSIGKMYQNKKE